LGGLTLDERQVADLSSALGIMARRSKATAPDLGGLGRTWDVRWEKHGMCHLSYIYHSYILSKSYQNLIIILSKSYLILSKSYQNLIKSDQI